LLLPDYRISAPDLHRFESVMMSDPGEVGPEFGLDFFTESLSSFFGAENDVNTRARISVRHGRPSGTLSNHLRLPSAEALR
jgi:hypothetical protein